MNRAPGRAGAFLPARITSLYRNNQILFWACIVIFVNQLGFGSIVPVVPLYADEFGVSQFAIGMTIAIYGLARFGMNVPTSFIADRYGRHVALAMGGGITVAGNLICGLADVYWLFLGGRFVAGAGAAMVITGTQIVVTDISTRSNRGRMMAVYQGTFLFAVGFGPVPGGLLAEYVSLSAPFLAYAALGSAVAALAWIKIPDTGEFSRRAASDQLGPPLGLGKQIRLLTAQRGFALIAVVSFTVFFARTGGVFNLIPTLAEDKAGLSPSQIGLGLGLISLVGLVLAYPSGVMVDRWGRKTVIVPSALITGASMFLFAIMPDFLWFMLACAAWSVATGIAGPAPAAYAADMAPPGMNASAMGLYRMLADTGYILGPLLLGLSADLVSAEAALYATGVMVLAAGVVFAIFAPESHRRETVAEPAYNNSPAPSEAPGSQDSGR